jgi:dihydroorotase
MARAQLLVTGRMLQADGSLARGGFTVLDGRVVDAGPHLSAPERVDFGERLVLPGAVDPHVHFRDPGHPEKEDFASGTRAAALGGVTTVMDMPNTVPPVFTRAALDEKLERARAKARVDFGLYAGLDEKGASLSILPEASALKIYLGSTTGELLVRDPEVVRRALVAAARAGRTVTVHAESQDCLDRHAHLAGEGYGSHAAARPPECEADAIRRLAAAARGTGARVHVAHLSTRAGLEALRGTGFTSEATPHHLLLADARLAEGGRFKMNPPLRSEADRRALFEAFARGDVLVLASDHAPHTAQEKAAPRQGACPSGVPGVQTLVPLLLALAKEGRLPLARLADASTAAARVFRLPGKGVLGPGQDADFAAYDLGDVRSVRGEELASRAGWSPFEGMPAIFPTDVVVRGHAVVAGGTLVADAPRGAFLRPA